MWERRIKKVQTEPHWLGEIERDIPWDGVSRIVCHVCVWSAFLSLAPCIPVLIHMQICMENRYLEVMGQWGWLTPCTKNVVVFCNQFVQGKEVLGYLPCCYAPELHINVKQSCDGCILLMIIGFCVTTDYFRRGPTTAVQHNFCCQWWNNCIGEQRRPCERSSSWQWDSNRSGTSCWCRDRESCCGFSGNVFMWVAEGINVDAVWSLPKISKLIGVSVLLVSLEWGQILISIFPDCDSLHSLWKWITSSLILVVHLSST